MKKEYLLKKKLSINNLLPIKTFSKNIQQKNQHAPETRNNTYFTGEDERSTIELPELLDKYEVDRWQKKFTIQKNKINKLKYAIFFKKYAYNKIAIPYLFPYKFNSIMKTKVRMKKKDVPLMYDYYMISSLIKKEKCLVTMKFCDIEIFIDEYDYFINYFEIKEYYVIMRYLLTFIYNKDPLSFSKNFYYTKHNNKLENEFEMTVNDIYKSKLDDSSKKIIKKKYKYFFIKDVPMKNVPNIVPNYFNNCESIKRLFKKYVFKQKYIKSERNKIIPIKKENNIMNDEDYILGDFSLSLDYSLYNFDIITKRENPFYENKNKKQNDVDDIYEIEELIIQIEKAIKTKNEYQNNIIKSELNKKHKINNQRTINTEKNLFSKKKKIFKNKFNKQNIIMNTFKFNDKNNASKKSSMPPLSSQSNQKKKLFLLQNQNTTATNKNLDFFTKNSTLKNNNQFSSLNTLSSSRKNLKDGSDFIRNILKTKKKQAIIFKTMIETILSSNNFLQRNDIITNHTNCRIRNLSKIKNDNKNFALNKRRLYSYKSLPKKEMVKTITKSIIKHRKSKTIDFDKMMRSKKTKLIK